MAQGTYLDRILFAKERMIFLSKNGQDEYINMLAQGSNIVPTNLDEFEYNHSNDPIVLRGILKYKIIRKCWRDHRDFYYVDTGYFGNEANALNPNGWKRWHRLVKNNIQHNDIVSRPDDRFRKFKKEFKPWKKTGTQILVAAPDEKPCKFYGITQDAWIADTVNTIKQHTDRPIEVRQRTKNRQDRVITNTLQQALDNDVFALVTYNSNSATEAIFHGIPAFTMAPVHAAAPVSLQDLSKIETPYYADSDKLYAWACHLAYGQFHIGELANGTAMRMVQETL